MSPDLSLLFTLTGSAEIEQLGKVQDGERIKIDFRGKAAEDSPIAGKAHGTSWILIGPLGPGDTSAVQELQTPSGGRLVLELRGYAQQPNGSKFEIRASGMIRTSAASLLHFNGRIALMVQTVAADDAVRVDAYVF